MKRKEISGRQQRGVGYNSERIVAAERQNKLEHAHAAIRQKILEREKERMFKLRSDSSAFQNQLYINYYIKIIYINNNRDVAILRERDEMIRVKTRSTGWSAVAIPCDDTNELRHKVRAFFSQSKNKHSILSVASHLADCDSGANENESCNN